MRLMTNNPTKRVGIEGYGLSVVKWVSIEVTPNEFNNDYFNCKLFKMGHLLKMVAPGFAA
jgi:3,4-dihydroxy 2-butanone 4-phosphate synthase/GTP cyclohydrolase II